MNRNTYLRWFRGPEHFIWDWQPWSKDDRWRRGYLRVRVFSFGFNFYYGENFER